MPSPERVTQEAGGDLGEKSRRPDFTRRRRGAWLYSLGLHVSILLLLGLLVRHLPRGIVETVERSGGIVLVQHQGERTEYYAAEDSPDSAAAQSPAASALSSPAELELSLPGSLPEAGQESISLSGGPQQDPVEALLQSQGGRETGEYAVETGVFGVKAKGSRFLYVFDRSASMSALEGRPLAAAKAQMVRSLQDLGETQQFQVIFYNNEPTILNPFYPRPPKLLFADKQNRQLATEHIRGIVASGTTRHEDALLLALKMNPDVVFFLTDAEQPVMTIQEMERVCRRNQSVGASIYAIQFGIGPPQGGENFLARLARRNEGNHVYVDVTRLPARVP